MPKLAKLTAKNYKDVLAIKIASHNKTFISTMAETLIQASYTEGWEGYAYMDNDEVIGFCSIAPFKYGDVSGWKICKLVIDESKNGRGFGKGLLNDILEMLDSRTNIVSLSVDNNNKVAIGLYEALGFTRETTRSKYIYMVRKTKLKN